MQTIKLHRVVKAPVNKVFRAFIDPLAYAAWIPPYGFLCIVDKMEPHEGGEYHMAFVNFTTGSRHSFGGKILKVTPDEFISYSDQFDDPSMPNVMTTSVSFRQTTAGTELNITQENVPEAIPAEMCYLGWQDSLEKLAKLVEPEIPDA